MIKQLSLLLLGLVITFFSYPVWINFLYRFKLRERVREEGPKTHFKKQGTPTMGGVVFILVAVILTLIFNWSRGQTIFPIFVVAVSSWLGFIEDFFKAYRKSNLRRKIRSGLEPIVTKSKITSGTYNLLLLPWDLVRELIRTLSSGEDNGDFKPQYKFFLQFILGVFVAGWVYFRLGWSSLWLPLYGEVELGILYPVLISFLFVFMLNAVAITDGLDGLVGGLAAISLIAFWVVASQLQFLGLATLSAVFVGTLIAFLYFNVFPARMFMGDVGAYGLAALLFMVPLIMRREFIILPVCIVFILDGGLSGNLQQLVVRFTGKRVFKMAPLHHHFELLGWPETKVTMRFWLAGIVFAFVGTLLAIF